MESLNSPPPCRLSVLWGAYEPARLLSVHDGLYCCRFLDGATRWATLSELLLPDMPAPAHSWHAAAVLALRDDARDRYVPASFVRASSRGCEVRAETAPPSAPRTVQPAELRMPLGLGPTLGRARPLAPGELLYALRGRWVGARLGRSSRRFLSRNVTLDLGDEGERSVWVSGGQCIPLDPSAAPTELAAGARVVAIAAEGELVEAEVLYVEPAAPPPDDGGADDADELAARLLDDAGAVWRLPLRRLRPRLDPCLRVLVACGGFQLGTVCSLSAEGAFLVELATGGRRAVYAAEVVSMVTHSLPLPQHSLVALMPKDRPTDALPRWLPTASVVDTSPDGGKCRLRISAAQQPFTVLLRSEDASPLLEVDATGLLKSVAERSAASEAGLRTGDRVHMCIGQSDVKERRRRLPNLCGVVATQGLNQAHVNEVFKRSRVAEVGVECAELVRAFTAELGASTTGECEVERGRLWTPLHSRACDVTWEAVNIGDTVYVMAGGWREAVVEMQENDFYLVNFGTERRWASAGELAWHDSAPLPFELFEGKNVLAWDNRIQAFQSARVTSVNSHRCQVVFDLGATARVPVQLTRERWSSPVRVMGLWGNYYRAVILESLGGLLRVQFGGGQLRWMLPEQTLSDEPPGADDIAVDSFVAVSRAAISARGGVGGCDAAEQSVCFQRAVVTAFDPLADLCDVKCEDGQRATIPRTELRVPLDETAVLSEGASCVALFGTWSPGVVLGLGDEVRTTGRYQVIMSHPGGRWPTWLARREFVSADGGDQSEASPLWRLRRGAPVVVIEEDGTWNDALLVSPCTEDDGGVGYAKVLMADGTELVTPGTALRARGGDGHPVLQAFEHAQSSIHQFQLHAALQLQRVARGHICRRAVKLPRRGEAQERVTWRPHGSTHPVAHHPQHVEAHQASAVVEAEQRHDSTLEGGDTASDGDAAAFEGGDAASEAGDMASEAGDMVSEAGDMASEAGDGASASCASVSCASAHSEDDCSPLASSHAQHSSGTSDAAGASAPAPAARGRTARDGCSAITAPSPEPSCPQQWDEAARPRSDSGAAREGHVAPPRSAKLLDELVPQEMREQLVAFEKQTAELREALARLSTKVSAEMDKKGRMSRRLDQGLHAPPPDAAQLKKTLEMVRKRNQQLKALQANFQHPDDAVNKESEAVARIGGEVFKLQRQIDENSKSLQLIDRKLDDARVMAQVEKDASGLDAELQYEAFLMRIMDLERRQREKAEHAFASEQKVRAEWEWWLHLLTATSRLLQAKADAGNEHARLTSSAPQVDNLHPGAALLVERLNRQESRMSSLRGMLKKLDEKEEELRADILKAKAKISAHRAMPPPAAKTSKTTTTPIGKSPRTSRPRQNELPELKSVDATAPNPLTKKEEVDIEALSRRRDSRFVDDPANTSDQQGTHHRQHWQ